MTGLLKGVSESSVDIALLHNKRDRAFLLYHMATSGRSSQHQSIIDLVEEGVVAAALKMGRSRRPSAIVL